MDYHYVSANSIQMFKAVGQNPRTCWCKTLLQHLRNEVTGLILVNNVNRTSCCLNTSQNKRIDSITKQKHCLHTQLHFETSFCVKQVEYTIETVTLIFMSKYSFSYHVNQVLRLTINHNYCLYGYFFFFKLFSENESNRFNVVPYHFSNIDMVVSYKTTHTS